MTAIVVGNSAVDAWRAGAQHLLANGGRQRNLLTEIGDPLAFQTAWLTEFDPKRVDAKDRLSVVVKVLFPHDEKRQDESRAEFYDRWGKVLARGRKTRLLAPGWGTYFQRLISADGSENQVERVIYALTHWPRAEASLYAHLSVPRIDKPRRMGSPCLQYLEFLWKADDSIDLVAVYRNHDFLNKTLGNFLGLCNLLRFVAAESDKGVGIVTCHSVHAYYDSGPKLRALIGD